MTDNVHVLSAQNAYDIAIGFYSAANGNELSDLIAGQLIADGDAEIGTPAPTGGGGGGSYDDTALVATTVANAAAIALKADAAATTTALDGKVDVDITPNLLITNRTTTAGDDGALILNEGAVDYTLTAADDTIPNGCTIQQVSTGTASFVTDGVTYATVNAGDMLVVQKTSVANEFSVTYIPVTPATASAGVNQLTELKIAASAYMLLSTTGRTLDTKQIENDVLEMLPFIPSSNFTCTEIGLDVTTAQASSVAIAMVYEADPDDVFDLTLVDDSTEMDLSTTGYQGGTISVTFEAGKLYFIGTLATGVTTNATIRAYHRESLTGLGWSGSDVTTSGNVESSVRKGGFTYASGAPATITMDQSYFGSATVTAAIIKTS